MTVQTVFEPLIDAGLTVTVRHDGRLLVAPSERITEALDVHIRAHRDELIAALETTPRLFDWPPPAPAWFAAWMEADDALRAATMLAGRQRLELSRKQRR